MGSRLHFKEIMHGKPLHYKDDVRAFKREYAEALDREDPLRRFREEFIIPSKSALKCRTLKQATSDSGEGSQQECLYFCGNSLGLQPRRTKDHVRAQLDTWATQGVQGHFKQMEDSPLKPWMHMDDLASEQMAKIVGASPKEVVVMETLTANLHFLMASFYRPDNERYKIILETKAFPSDHYAVESQLRHHNLDPSEAMILIQPKDPKIPYLSTEHILSIIDEHASTTALLLLPGIQYYTGQLFDMPKITEYAHSKGLIVGWDLAHAVGNVEIKLHEWDVDFAAWCTYKYLNSGPGAMGGLFVHEKHGQVDMSKPDGQRFRDRLSGWWGGDKDVRFRMDNNFIPIRGAGGFQLSNPSALDLAAVIASLEVFNETSMADLRKKSLHITGYLEHLLLKYPLNSEAKAYKIITPSNPEERGAQLSVLLEPGLLDTVMVELEENGVILDERKPDVIRVAPAPLYNSYTDVWEFVQILNAALKKAIQVRGESNGTAAVNGAKE